METEAETEPLPATLARLAKCLDLVAVDLAETSERVDQLGAAVDDLLRTLLSR